MTQDDGSITYRDAGVDIDAGNALVDRIKPIAARTRRPGVLAGLGGFGALFELPKSGYREPVLVSGTDGVGTKLMLAQAMNKHDTIGIDLVAMCVNDVLAQGAEPLFFLDYFACGKLSVEIAAQVVDGIGRGCELAGCALVGGETAEMPGMYAAGEYDLAGFCVGIAEKTRLLDGAQVRAGDLLIGIASSGPHANGYSLIRKLLGVSGANLRQPFDGATLGERLMEPTHIYVRALLALMQNAEIHALAHITGGGITDNLPRVLPPGLHAEIDLTTWRRPPIFDWLADTGNLPPAEMLRTFNCGIGMLVVAPDHACAAVLRGVSDYGFGATLIGRIISADGAPAVRYIGLQPEQNAL